MAAPTGAYVMRNAVVTVGTDEYANQCTKAVLTPDAPIQTLRTLVPDGIVQDVDSNVWTLSLTLIQDHRAADSTATPAVPAGLARLLSDNHGSQLTLHLEPKAGGVAKEVTVIAKAVDFGGEQGSFATADVDLPVIGQPTTIDPT